MYDVDNSLRAVSDIMATIPHVMFCVKDLNGVYLAANRTFAERAVASSQGDVIGRTAHDLFPIELADTYAAQDAEVLSTGRQLSNELEFITRPDGSIGWYLTTKSRISDDLGNPTGIVSISIDLQTPADAAAPHAALAKAVEFARDNIGHTTTVAEMAEHAGMPSRQLERSMSRILGLSPKQLVIRLRLEAGMHQLNTSDDSIADIALRCGYYDQSDFTRHFTRVVGMSPRGFRRSRSL